jgi:hypothetical protein
VVSETLLNLLNFYNAQPYNQEIINVHHDVYSALDEDPKISANQLKAEVL